ncbi:MAG: site-specific DNA-methyltransferase [Firmicutes bacterium]|nr:site-specific DNA-methyltransferase [Bacillota bacterium]
MRVALNEGDQIVKLLQADLGFHAAGSGHARHGFHAFAAKFPPQLPAWFIEGLTEPGEVVFDPFLGSGTTVVEAMRLNRRAQGIDIDPLAILMSRVKTSSLNPDQVSMMGRAIVHQAQIDQRDPDTLLCHVDRRFSDKKDREFIDYWFLPSTILELEALMEGI